MRERCLRTVLISPMVAPERSSARVTACLSANETPAAGAIQLAEAPPDISTSTRSFALGAIGELERAVGRFQAGGIGNRMAGFDHGHDPQRPAVAVARHRDPAQAFGDQALTD